MCIYEFVTVPFAVPFLFIMIQDLWQIKLIAIPQYSVEPKWLNNNFFIVNNRFFPGDT